MQALIKTIEPNFYLLLPVSEATHQGHNQKLLVKGAIRSCLLRVHWKLSVKGTLEVAQGRHIGSCLLRVHQKFVEGASEVIQGGCIKHQKSLKEGALSIRSHSRRVHQKSSSKGASEVTQGGHIRSCLPRVHQSCLSRAHRLEAASSTDVQARYSAQCRHSI